MKTHLSIDEVWEYQWVKNHFSLIPVQKLCCPVVPIRIHIMFMIFYDLDMIVKNWCILAQRYVEAPLGDSPSEYDKARNPPGQVLPTQCHGRMCLHVCWAFIAALSSLWVIFFTFNLPFIVITGSLTHEVHFCSLVGVWGVCYSKNTHAKTQAMSGTVHWGFESGPRAGCRDSPAQQNMVI